MHLWGKDFTRRDLEGYVGDLRQIADIRLSTLDDGIERGVRVADVRTGSGLDFTVLLDRAMDIGTATYHGIPLAWQSGTGAANPSRYEPEGRGWLRTFHGGLLALCGLSHAGRPDNDPENGEALGLHGRIGTTPAHDIRIERAWDEGALRLRGTVDEVSLFGWRLRLERTITVTIGKPEILVNDTVRNLAGVPAPLMVLYHCNFGFPLISPDSEFISPATKVTPRDKDAEPGIDTWHTMHAPVPGYAEQVFFHHIEPSPTPVGVTIRNKALGIGVETFFDARTLNYLTQWKQLGFADYTQGVEPGNCWPEGRVAARETGRLQMLGPGESRAFMLGFRVV